MDNNENRNEYYDENGVLSNSFEQEKNQSEAKTENVEPETQNNSYETDNNGQNYYQNNQTYDYGNQNYYQQSNNQNYGGNDYYGQQSGQNFSKPPKKKHTGLVIAIVATAAILTAGILVTVTSMYNGIKSKKTETPVISEMETKEQQKYDDIGTTNTDSIESTKTGSVVVTDVSDIVSNSMPSVVAITSKTLVEANNDYIDDIWGYYFGNGNQGNNHKEYEQEAAGSGIIIDQTDTELLIVTNNHVVAGSDSLTIQFNGEDEEGSIDAYIKGTDPSADVAVVAVKLEDIPSQVMKNIKKATIGDSDSVEVGDGVIAIGNALGYGQSVTSGVISAKDRKVTIEDKTMTLLQTDAAINGGNSGGALLNSKGEVIGINVAKYSSNGSMTSSSIEGMGFAIPVSSVKNIISELEKRETRAKLTDEERGYLSVTVNDVPDEAAEMYGVPKGAYVYSVIKGGAAEKAGIMEHDVIVKFDGQTISSSSDLMNLLQYYKAGEKVKVTISYRSGRTYEEKEVEITLDEKSASDDTVQNNMNNR